MAKLVTDAVLKKNIEDILTELVNSTYQWEEYSETEISDILEISDQEAMELSKIINDNVKSNTKIWSSNKTDSEIKSALIEANKYADDLVANLSNIKLDIVDALPDSTTVNKSTIYILKDSSGGTNNTLNVWSDTTSAFVEVGKLSVNMDNYYTKSEVDAELAKKANADEVLKPDAIVADLTTTSGSTTLSTAGLQTELDKKANDDVVVKTADIVTTIDSTSTDSKVPSAKAVYVFGDNFRRKSTVADVPKTTITFSDTTNYEPLDDTNNYYEVIDGTCYVSLFVRCHVPIIPAMVVTTLPKAKRREYKPLCPWDKATDSMSCNISTDGKLYLQLGTTGGAYIHTFSYQVAES